MYTTFQVTEKDPTTFQSLELNENTSDHLTIASPQTPPEGAHTARAVTIAVCATLAPLTAIANVAALLHLCRERERKRRVRSRRLLLHLCVGALLQALFVHSLTLAHETLVWWPAGDRLCRVLLALQDLFYLLVSFLLVAIALNMCETTS